ncbi:Mim2p [Sporobolomyces koalae]|uniref:Mim2p n=1 Tax=Sporobolomyces koalae TaxID=500713 RepID=UPI0031736565
MMDAIGPTQQGSLALSDGTHLAYTVHVADSRRTRQQIALVAHPWGRLGGNRKDHMVVSISRELQNKGYTVVRFDTRGSGDSEGAPSWTGSTEAQDFETMLNSVLLPLLETSNSGSTPASPTNVDLVLCGYSFGSLLASFCTPPVSNSRFTFDTRYLLLSYPLSVLWALTSFRSTSFARALETRATDRNKICVVFGDKDQFSSVLKLRKWSNHLVQFAGDNTVTVVEVEGADHFWARASDKRAALDGIASSSSPTTTGGSPQPPTALVTDFEGYLSSSQWLEPPRTFPPKRQDPTTMSGRNPRSRSTSSTSSIRYLSSSDDDEEETEDEDDYYEREAQLQFEESVRQLQALVNLVVVPWVSRYFGRKWSYALFERYLQVGLGKRFFVGNRISTWLVTKGWR